jgi:hypothetical protein
VVAGRAASARPDEQATAVTPEARQASRNGARFGVLSLVFAAVLAVVGIAGRLELPRIRSGLSVASGALLVVGLAVNRRPPHHHRVALMTSLVVHEGRRFPAFCGALVWADFERLCAIRRRGIIERPRGTCASVGHDQPRQIRPALRRSRGRKSLRRRREADERSPICTSRTRRGLVSASGRVPGFLVPLSSRME